MRAAAARADIGETEPAFSEYDLSHFYHAASDDILEIPSRFHEWYQSAVPAGYYLYLQPLQQGADPRVSVRSRKNNRPVDLLNLSSYNYLGLASRPEVKEAAWQALETYGLGASGSPLLSGTMEIHEQLAEELADFKNKPRAVLFPTGYSTGLGFVSALMRPGDTVVCDQYAHASTVDGAVLARSRTVYFRHNDPAHLDRVLRRATGRKLVIVEGVYSMDGDLCELPDIVSVSRRHGARILLDEAHSTFLFGEHGRGVAEHFGLETEIDFQLGTFSKVLGGQGGFISCSAQVADYLNAYARSRLFSCNLAPPIAAGVLAALRIARTEPELRHTLWRNVEHLRSRLTAAGVDIGRTASQIIPVMVYDDSRVFAIADAVQERGLFLPPVTYPAVAKNKSRLRIAVSAAHSRDQLDTAAAVISETMRARGGYR